mgnify:CR=1 FL=1
MKFSKSIFIQSLSLVTCALLLTSCGTTSKASAGIDPNRAVTELAPVVRQAEKPYEGVYYSLFVRSFADSNGDGIGDFNGIIAKLDYLNDGDDATTSDLGITGIWLLPIFPSPSYHGYDVDDYYDVNPDYGTMEDFERLLSECKKRGISVIIDMTCNHSSTYNEWFTASRNASDPHRTWYHWINETTPGYNFGAKIWGHNLWNQDFQHKEDYYAGEFGRHMPDFNLEDKGLREEFKKVMKFWMDKGVAGFRYDAAGHVYDSIKYPAGTDSTGNAVKWWKEITDFNRSVNPDTYNVGEVWDINSIRAQYIAGLGSDFHFDMGDKYIVEQLKYEDAGKNTYANMLASDLGRYAQSNPNYIDAPFLTNHDQPRAAGLLSNKTEKLKCAAAMYLLAEGVPFMYYGEEIAMMSGTKDETKRTPMLWNKTSSAGKPRDKYQTTWSSAADCIYNKKTLSVAEMEKDPSSLLNYYKRLIRVRTSHPALFRGRLSAVDTGVAGLASWAMKCDEETAFVVCNVTGKAVSAKIPSGYESLNAVFISDGATGSVKGGTITVPAFGTIVLAGK